MASAIIEPVDPDVLHGVQKIASYIGETRTLTLQLLEREQLPAFRHGRGWRMRKCTYQRFVEARETALIGKLLAAAP
jgi:hypothetical protein